jgi:hypothetical protein
MRLPKPQTSLVLTAAFLLAGVGVASAAGMPSSSSIPNASAATKMAPPARDTLSLSSKQRKTAWKDLYVKSLNQKTPAGFKAVAGAVMPSSVTTAPVNNKAASDVPALKPYKFAMLQHKLVIVNPSDHKIAEVIKR